MKVIIVGAGEVGYHIARKLSKENKDVVLIDQNEDRLRTIADTLDVQTIEGSGAHPSILRDAGIETADMFVAVTDSDESNLVSCLISRVLSPTTTRIARIRNHELYQLKELGREDILGLTLAINPESEVVKTITRLMEVPGAVDVMDFAGGLVRLIGLKIGPDSPTVGQTMITLREGNPDVNVLIAAIYRENKVIIPHGQTRLEAGDLAYVVTRPEAIKDILRFFGLKPEPVRSVIVVGGGQVGTQLAQELERGPIKVKLIDRDPERCRQLSQNLDKTVILRGDGTDQALLEEENVSNCDFFVALTDDEEENVLSCLLAKRLGVRHTITRVNKFAYIPLVTAIGLDTLVSSRLSAVSAILRNIRRGKVVSVAALKGEDAEAIEFEAQSMSDVVNRPLKDLKFPAQALIAAIVRQGQVIIPGGQTVVEPKDHIIIFTRREAIGKVEKALSVKLEFFK